MMGKLGSQTRDGASTASTARRCSDSWSWRDAEKMAFPELRAWHCPVGARTMGSTVQCRVTKAGFPLRAGPCQNSATSCFRQSKNGESTWLLPSNHLWLQLTWQLATHPAMFQIRPREAWCLVLSHTRKWPGQPLEGMLRSHLLVFHFLIEWAEPGLYWESSHSLCFKIAYFPINLKRRQINLSILKKLRFKIWSWHLTSCWRVEHLRSFAFSSLLSW